MIIQCHDFLFRGFQDKGACLNKGTNVGDLSVSLLTKNQRPTQVPTMTVGETIEFYHTLCDTIKTSIKHQHKGKMWSPNFLVKKGFIK